MSKAGEYARMRSVGQPFQIAAGRFAQVTPDGNLTIGQDNVSADASPTEALAFARWILDTFGDTSWVAPHEKHHRLIGDPGEVAP